MHNRKTKEAIQEKLRFDQETLEAERLTTEKQADLELQKTLQLIENDGYEAKKKVLTSHLCSGGKRKSS